jgi:hypothetical protein
MRRIPADFLQGGVGQVRYQGAGKHHLDLYSLLTSIHSEYTLVQALALTEKDWAGRILVAGVPYVWSETSTVEDTSSLFSIRPTAKSSLAAGRFILEAKEGNFRFPVTFATADAAVLLTIPTGLIIQPVEFWWTVTTTFAGGSSSAIGVSSNKTSYTAKGDLLGGAAGDVAATLASGSSPIMGTIGAGFATNAQRRMFMIATNTLLFDRVTSVFTSGVGAVNMRARIIQL